MTAEQYLASFDGYDAVTTITEANVSTDYLAGEHLKDGEWLSVRWPDGQHTVERIDVLHGAASIKVHCRGLMVTVPLRLSSVRLRRLP